jgi:hypothetical protein
MLSDFFDYCLFLTPNGSLVQVFCEFPVIVLRDVNTLKQGDIVVVSSVHYNPNGEVVFLVQDAYYYAKHFAPLL